MKQNEKFEILEAALHSSLYVPNIGTLGITLTPEVKQGGKSVKSLEFVDDNRLVKVIAPMRMSNGSLKDVSLLIPATNFSYIILK